MREPSEFTKGKRISRRGGFRLFVNADVLNKAITNAGLPLEAQDLKVKSYALRGKKNVAQVILEIRIASNKTNEKTIHRE